jgi:hypothetical protein
MTYKKVNNNHLVIIQYKILPLIKNNLIFHTPIKMNNTIIKLPHWLNLILKIHHILIVHMV